MIDCLYQSISDCSKHQILTLVFLTDQQIKLLHWILLFCITTAKFGLVYRTFLEFPIPVS
jgi:hypothetical protein